MPVLFQSAKFDPPLTDEELRSIPKNDIHIGFCEKCKIIREDVTIRGKTVNVTDCVCTALMTHAADCGYVRSTRCPIGIACEAHGQDACMECDCDCQTTA